MRARKVVTKIVCACFSILILVLLGFLLYQGGKMAFAFGHRVFTESAVDEEGEGQDYAVQVTSDMGAMELGRLLQKKGLVRDANLFAVQLKLSAYANTIKEGTYTLSTSMTAWEMMRVMSAEELDDTETEE